MGSRELRCDGMMRQRLEELNKEICDGFFRNCLDRSEAAIIDQFRQSGVEGTLFAVQYGAGGITFQALDGTEFYVMLDREFDEKGFELPRHDHEKYYLLKNGEPLDLEPESRSLSCIFRELSRIIHSEDDPDVDR